MVPRMPRPAEGTSQFDSLAEGDVNVSARRKLWQSNHSDPQTASLLEQDADLFLHQSLSTPCLNVLLRADGIYIEDMTGRRLMDFHGNSVHQLGYGHPQVIEAIKRQLDEMSFCPRRYTNQPAIELARKLTDLAPAGLEKVLLAPSGAVAIGIALTLARIATGRHKTLAFWGSFHGATLQAATLGGESLFRDGIGPLVPGAMHVMPPNLYRCAHGCGGACDLACAQALEDVLAREKDIGAVVAEPIRCTTVVPPPPGYWQHVREACDRHGALLIFDEIPTCLGRTGQMFACETFGVAPDILVLGKGLGGGVMPLAAVVAQRRLDAAGDRAIGHYTHEKSPLAAAAALAAIECIERDDLLGHTRTVGQRAVERLNEMRTRHRLIGDVRGVGLLIGVELVNEDGSPAVDAADAVMYAALERGLSFKVSNGNVLTLTPPLIITPSQMDAALQIIDDSLAAVQEGLDVRQSA